MFYRVSAQLKLENAAEYFRKLTDGTIERQRPDGAEIVASMHRAVLTDAGRVLWSEVCYCPTPLAHERATVLDLHFDDLKTDVIDDYQDFEGRPFMEHLAAVAENTHSDA